MTDQNPIEKQILETWRIHQRILLHMLDHIPEEALSSTLSKRGGRDISRQMAHLHTVRLSRLSSFAKKQGIEPIEFVSKDQPGKERLREALVQSGGLMERCLAHCLEKDGQVSNFKRGAVPMLGYFIAHESHHRGSILLTMKQSGHKLPDELKWGIWEWNKI